MLELVEERGNIEMGVVVVDGGIIVEGHLRLLGRVEHILQSCSCPRRINIFIVRVIHPAVIDELLLLLLCDSLRVINLHLLFIDMNTPVVLSSSRRTEFLLPLCSHLSNIRRLLWWMLLRLHCLKYRIGHHRASSFVSDLEVVVNELICQAFDLQGD
jgi:hypothetical protein